MSDFDSLVDDSVSQQPAASAINNQPIEVASPAHAPSAATSMDTSSFDSLVDDTEKYSTPTEQIKAGLEGLGRGFLGPVIPAMEKSMGVKPADILGRQEANPVTHGVGEAAGLIGGLLTGSGEAALMTKVGRMATEASGLAKATTYGARVGEAAVQQAAEMAVLQSGDEAAKMILQDPNTSAESAIANIGLASALGGGVGAFATGAISPLWKATAGPKVEQLFNAIKNKANGSSAITIGSDLEQDLVKLGVEPTAIQRADISDHPTAKGFIKDLSRAENEAILSEKADLQSKVANSVMEPLGTNLEQMQVYDNAAAGRELKDTVIKNIKDRFMPLWEGMDKRNAEAALISVSDDARLDLRNRLIEKGITEAAGDDAILNTYIKAGDQLLNHESLAGFDKMDTQLRKTASHFGTDPNLAHASRDIRSIIKDFKENVIEKAALQSERAGIEGATEQGQKLIEERAALNKAYAQAEGFREELGDHFKITRPDNARQFMQAVENDITPEQIMKKFSIKDNIEGARFLKQYMPEAFEHVIKNEQRAILKPAIVAAAKKGDLPIDINKLNDIIQKTKGGKDEYLKTILPPEFIDRAEAAARIMQATTKAKDSGTPAGLYGVLKGVATSALASVGLATGHGLAQSALFSEIALRLGKIAPEQAKLMYLRFMASDQPIKSEGIKAAADFMHEVYNGERALIKSTAGVFKANGQVLAENQLPKVADRDKLDKNIDKMQKDPSLLAASQDGHVGHYLPGHQTAIAQTTTTAVQYLQALKPHPQQPNPLDKPIPPSPTQIARYNRALDIAQQPLIVMQHIKDGTLQSTDIQDLSHMYPGLYKRMAEKLTQNMQAASGDGEVIPYKTKVGISLFLGQPMDTSMQPASIQAAQPKQPQQQPQTGAPMKNRKGPNSLGKSNKAYMTPNQGAELDKANRD